MPINNHWTPEDPKIIDQPWDLPSQEIAKLRNNISLAEDGEVLVVTPWRSMFKGDRHRESVGNGMEWIKSQLKIPWDVETTHWIRQFHTVWIWSVNRKTICCVLGARWYGLTPHDLIVAVLNFPFAYLPWPGRSVSVWSSNWPRRTLVAGNPILNQFSHIFPL